MAQIVTWGKVPLNGEVTIQGSKNAALPLMAASVLHRGRTVLHNCPDILDVEYMSEILREIGCTVSREGSTLAINAADIHTCCVSAKNATKLRASVLLMGSLLGRCGSAKLPFPGGCPIGSRPIDLHLNAFREMGAKPEESAGTLSLRAESRDKAGSLRLSGCRIRLPFPSVGATENILLGAVLARGTTVAKGCAREPEIAELCRFLREKGAVIADDGDGTLEITGVEELRDSEYTLMPDRIVAGTYLLAAAGTRGRVKMKQDSVRHLDALFDVLERTGASISLEDGMVCMDAGNARRPAAQVATGPYPGFPTDLQSQLMVFLSGADGVSCIEENLFESRFLIAGELTKMGADIAIDGNRARINGAAGLHGTQVQARELRGGAALVAAGLMAQGKTLIGGEHFIRRGYEDICRDLAQLGARIERIG